MKEKTKPLDADTIQQGLTGTITSKNEIYKTSQTLGIKKDEIKCLIKKRKYTILYATVFIIAGLVTGNYYSIGSHYGGCSISDFDTLKWFL
jgi:hypothetical protein